jgi:hypothetical protein
MGKLREALAQAKQRLGLPAATRVVSCYEAGRDGFWLHRQLRSMGVDNDVVDSSTIEVNRRKRRAKTDRIDGEHLLTQLNLVTADEVGRADSLQNRLLANGEVGQDANTRDLIVGIEELVELVSSVLPLRPGDVIGIGTPEGAGPLVPGEKVTISIERGGAMTLPVVEADVTSPRAY